MIKEKKVTIKADQKDIDLILRHCNNVKWGINGMFEYGSMTVEELHSVADMFGCIKVLLDINDDGVYPNIYTRKVK